MRRGQAALEFLSTYGWAILVVLVMIGALSYFGVTNPQNLLPEKCVLETGFGCKDFVAQADGSDDLQLRLTMVNGLGASYVISGMNATYLGGSTEEASCVLDGAGSYPLSLQAEAQQGFTCTFTGVTAPPEGTPVKFQLDFGHRKVQGAYEKTGSGEIAAKVQ